MNNRGNLGIGLDIENNIEIAVSFGCVEMAIEAPFFSEIFAEKIIIIIVEGIRGKLAKPSGQNAPQKSIFTPPLNLKE